MVFVVTLVGLAVTALAHTLPGRFLLDVMAGDRAVWHMSRDEPATIYLTFDDGPNPTTTPDLLDVLADEGIPATFFLIDAHVTDETAPLVRRMFDEGHAVGIHSATRAYMLLSPDDFASTLTAAADRIEQAGGTRPCRAFRPHAGWRGGEMYAGLDQADYRLVGWGWNRWDWNWFRRRTSDSIVNRIAPRAAAGDIIVLHDGDESAPRQDQRQTVEATARLIPLLRARGFGFGAVCRNDDGASNAARPQ
jgi:peptidoglycan/xylan/chitin deacetylase (PgdA/CDA1 family)